MPETTQPSYVSAKYIAEDLQITERWVREWIAAGELPSVRFSRKVVRVPRAAYEDFVNRRKSETVARA